MLFQSLEGIQALWNLNPLGQAYGRCGFNPWKGFRLFGTKDRGRTTDHLSKFQSLEGIQALWNDRDLVFAN